MPWTETCIMEERVKFIMEVLDGIYSMAELCNYYGISRKTGYKWLDRYQQGSIESLRNRSPLPEHSKFLNPTINKFARITVIVISSIRVFHGLIMSAGYILYDFVPLEQMIGSVCIILVHIFYVIILTRPKVKEQFK